MNAYTTDSTHILDVSRSAFLMHEIMLLEDDYACINGLVHILDFKQTSSSQLLQMTPPFLKKMATWIEQAMPLRAVGFHYMHTPKAFEPVFNVFKPMLPKKIQNRVCTYICN